MYIYKKLIVSCFAHCIFVFFFVFDVLVKFDDLFFFGFLHVMYIKQHQKKIITNFSFSFILYNYLNNFLYYI